LFDFMVDALVAIPAKANAAGHIERVVPHLIPGGVTHVQYVDDTMILIKPATMGVANLKLILLCFDNMWGLKLKLAKSEVVVTWVMEDGQ
jgi:hypothetical protein